MAAPITIRPAAPADRSVVADLAVDNEMFAPDELDDFLAAFDGALAGEIEGHQWFVAVDDARPLAAAYVAPEPFADRVWNLHFLAVDPAQHGTGLGTHLIAHVEQLLRAMGEEVARVLIIETSSTDQYAPTRTFYAARGFDEEARIRDYYGPGDGKVVFWKSLLGQ